MRGGLVVALDGDAGSDAPEACDAVNAYLEVFVAGVVGVCYPVCEVLVCVGVLAYALEEGLHAVAVCGVVAGAQLDAEDLAKGYAEGFVGVEVVLLDGYGCAFG